MGVEINGVPVLFLRGRYDSMCRMTENFKNADESAGSSEEFDLDSLEVDLAMLLVSKALHDIALNTFDAPGWDSEALSASLRGWLKDRGV